MEIELWDEQIKEKVNAFIESDQELTSEYCHKLIDWAVSGPERDKERRYYIFEHLTNRLEEAERYKSKIDPIFNQAMDTIKRKRELMKKHREKNDL